MSDNRSLQSATVDSEDRLFKLLKKPDFHNMRIIYIKYIAADGKHITANPREEFFQEHGWTTEEFLAEYKRRKI